jgi:hypothetical protein
MESIFKRPKMHANRLKRKLPGIPALDAENEQKEDDKE